MLADSVTHFKDNEMGCFLSTLCGPMDSLEKCRAAGSVLTGVHDLEVSADHGLCQGGSLAMLMRPHSMWCFVLPMLRQEGAVGIWQ